MLNINIAQVEGSGTCMAIPDGRPMPDAKTVPVPFELNSSTVPSKEFAT